MTKPLFGAEETAAVADVLASGWVTQGPKVAEFEAAIAAFTCAAHVVAVTSCTTALQLTLMAYGIGAGDEVIVPSHTYIATVNAIVLSGATPVLVDIRGDTFTIDPVLVAAAVSPRTKAILPVHLGLAADLDAIYDVAEQHELRVIEDGAQALGASYHGRMVGDARDAVCFSFHPRKVVTTGEGGAIATNDAALAADVRALRHHCMSVSDAARHSSTSVVIEEYGDVGLNARMSDLQAAVGVAQMHRLQWILERRRELAARYDDFLERNVAWLRPVVCPPDRTHSYVSYVARLAPGAPVTRDELMHELLERGVASRPGVMSVHRQLAYRERFADVSLPESEAASRDTVILPLYPQMTAAEFEMVGRSLATVARVTVR
ncbi:MAG: DegT/DnrJ/EryC1/StrS family aminotransferase [Actinomycetota bacterium]